MPSNKKINLSKKQNLPQMLPLKKRIKSFCEVESTYDEKAAKEEALRCLDCKHKPCVSMCPASVDIPNFIKCIYNGKIEEGYSILYKANNFPDICGRVCGQETQCQSACVRGKNGEPVAIGRLERYVADNYMSKEIVKKYLHNKPLKNISVAVIGSGPSGLACAFDLILTGYSVTIFESLSLPGGALTYGIPKFRLPMDILENEIEFLKEIGAEFKTNITIGAGGISIDKLLNELNYKAVYIATGAALPKSLSIPGENLEGVYSANEFLKAVNLASFKTYNCKFLLAGYKRAIVIGGGDVAIDAARCAKRLGLDVTIAYRREEKDMPAEKKEIKSAKEEGVKFIFKSAPVAIKAENSKITRVEFCKSNYKIMESFGSEKFFLDTDCMIIAIGSTNTGSYMFQELNTDLEGKIIIDKETMKTSKPGVFAGGDAVSGPSTVILAIKDGKNAAFNINKYLSLGDA